WAKHLTGIDPAAVTSRQALARLPILRKCELLERQAAAPPLGGFATAGLGALARVFVSPGPIFEPEGHGSDWWRTARALY
ncbi:phenylacetate--CoA ligase family protein, partial [Vibrio parahaemolyticus]